MKNNLFDLTGRVALITGGGRGLGRAIARGFAQAGADTFITGRNEAELRAAAIDIAADNDAQVQYWAGDLTRRDDVQRLADAAVQRLGKVDVLVNNAGGNVPQDITQVRDEDWDYIVQLNLSSCMALTRALAPGMKKRRWGRVIFMSSIMGLASTAGRSGYSATKAALLGLARACAIDLGSCNITVNCIAPGPFDTDLPRTVLTSEQWKAISNCTILNRFGTCEELIGPALLLASDAGSYITGSVLVVDGGAMAKAF